MFAVIAAIVFAIDTLVGAGVVKTSSQALSFDSLTAFGLFLLCLYFLIPTNFGGRK